VHKLAECTIDDKLATTMDEISILRGGNSFIISTIAISIKDMASSRINECIGLNPCKIRGLDKRRDNTFFKKSCFNI